MISGFRREIFTLLLIGVLLIVPGLISGRTQELLFLGLVVYTVWNLHNLRRLTRWLDKPSKKNVPESIGIWDELYYKLYQLYLRQRKSRKKLTKIVTRFQESTQALPYAVVVLNSSFEIDWYNQVARNLFGFKQARDNGVRVDNLIRDPAFVEYLNSKDFNDQAEIELGQRRVALRITPYGHGEYLLSAIDITQQQQLEDMRRDFIANASHELRTPITVISGYLEALIDQADDKMIAPLEKIQSQTERMTQILEDLIVLARLESKEWPMYPDIVDLAELLQEIHHDAQVLDDGRHEIILSVDEASIEGSRSELQMAITNLVTNAIRYTPVGGTIRIFCHSLRDTIQVGVEDDGIGIPPEHISRLTERFYRVDSGRSREAGGTGLGLAIVKHVLDRHNAALHIESHPDEGSVFRCDFR